MKEFKKLLSFTKGYRGLYLFGIISVITSQFIVILSPLVLRTTIDSIIGDLEIESVFFLRAVNALGGREDLRDNLYKIGLIIISIALLRGVFLYIKNTLSSQAAERIVENIKNDLYDHIQRLPYKYHVKAETGDLIQRCTSDVETIRKFLAIQVMEVIGSIFMLLFIFIVMLSINPTLAFISVALLPITFIFSIYFFKKIKTNFTASDEAEAALTSTLQENIIGVRVVKAFSRQKHEIENFDEKNKTYMKLTNKLVLNLSYYWALSDLLNITQIGLVIVVGSFFAVRGVISIGTLFTFTTYINMLVWPIRQMGRTLTDMGKAFVSIKRIEEILNEPIEDLAPTGVQNPIKGILEFNNLSFSYEDGKDVLRNISFKIKQGQTAAFIGPTGSGKSTLISLIDRLYDYERGSITLDGQELNSIDRNWVRRNIGLILQETFLYAKTIRENIRLSNPQLPDKNVVSAAKSSFIHDDILEFKEGYETLVGERGVSLSGGQKQRMAIARTLIRDLPIIIFDDSLSAVDSTTDREIRSSLKSRNEKSTTIVISHRISTVSEADIIFVLDKGQIVQRGTHKELIGEEGLYKRVFQAQSSYDDKVIAN
nr:ABC transporter ATP-binding protein [Tissierella sp.]